MASTGNENKLIAYCRVSTNNQELKNQELEIRRYCDTHRLTVDEWVKVTISSRRTPEERKIKDLINRLKQNDTLIVAELSRIGRSISQVLLMVDELRTKGAGLICIKEGIRFNGVNLDMPTKITLTTLSMLAEIERDLISERTKAGIERAREQGKQIGRKKGTLAKSKLDPHKDGIQELFDKGVTKASVCKIYGVSRCALDNFIKTRKVRTIKR